MYLYFKAIYSEMDPVHSFPISAAPPELPSSLHHLRAQNTWPLWPPAPAARLRRRRRDGAEGTDGPWWVGFFLSQGQGIS